MAALHSFTLKSFLRGEHVRVVTLAAGQVNSDSGNKSSNHEITQHSHAINIGSSFSKSSAGHIQRALKKKKRRSAAGSPSFSINDEYIIANTGTHSNCCAWFKAVS